MVDPKHCVSFCTICIVPSHIAEYLFRQLSFLVVSRCEYIENIYFCIHVGYIEKKTQHNLHNDKKDILNIIIQG